MALNSTPEDMGALLQQLRARIERLERPTSVVIGNWVVSQSQYGDLVADNINTGMRATLAEYDKSKTTGQAPINDPSWRII